MVLKIIRPSLYGCKLHFILLKILSMKTNFNVRAEKSIKDGIGAGRRARMRWKIFPPKMTKYWCIIYVHTYLLQGFTIYNTLDYVTHYFLSRHKIEESGLPMNDQILEFVVKKI